MRHMDKEATETSINTILDLVGLAKDRSTLSKDLSGGMKRRLSIGIALVGDPQVNLKFQL
jgi:ABC-type multidrug transport system ATPase subunit